MAKGFDEHKQRMDELAALGKGLARRSKSRCELGEATEGPLRPWEVPPVEGDPDLDATLLLCEPCVDGIEARTFQDDPRWRCLQTSAWSETSAAQVMAVRLVKRLAALDVAWAREFLENLYLEPEIESWVERAE